MNILFSTISGVDKIDGYHHASMLQKMGNVIYFISKPAGNLPLYDFQNRYIFPLGTSVNRIIEVIGVKPDLFLYVEPLGIIPEGIENSQFLTACVLSDCHCDLKPRQLISRFFDHVFLYHNNHLKYFKEHPKSNIHWFPYACDLSLFKPTGTERDIDVAFIGRKSLNLSRERQSILKKLSIRYKTNEQRYYKQDEIPGIYSRAKIVLNLPLADDLNFRTFEAMSCGAMLLTHRVNNGQELLFEEGKHYAAFADEKELFDKIAYYLTRPDERMVVAAAGLAEIQRHHRLEQRVDELLSIVQNRPERVAPIRQMSPAQIDRQYAWLYEYWRMVESGLSLAREARCAGRPWVPLLIPAIRSVLRRIKYL